MTASEQNAATPRRKSAAAVVLPILFSFTAWFLLLLTALSLGTLIPTVRSLLNLSVCFLVSGLLSALLSHLVFASKGPKAGATAPGSKGFGIWVLCVLAIACLGVLSAVHAHWHAKVYDVKLGLTLRFFPVSLSEFQVNIPDSRYAYPKLLKVVETDFDPVFYNKIKHADGGVRAWTPEIAKTEAVSAAHYAPYLEKKLAPLLKQKYAAYMKVDHLRASRDPLKIPVPRLGNLPVIAKFAKSYAVSLAVKGDTEKAWKMVRLQFALSDVLASDRSLLGKMVVLAIRSQGIDSAAGILLNRAGAVIPKDIVRRLQESSYSDLTFEGMKGELAYQFDVYNFIHQMNFSRFRELGGLSSLLMAGGGSSGAGLRLEYVVFSLLRRMGIVDLNSLAAAGYFSTVAAPGAWEQVSARGREGEGRINNLPSWPFLLVKSSLPSVSMLLREFESRARARLTLAFSELLRYRREHGKYPLKLSEARSRDIAPDVFTGGELLYEPAAGGKGFALCSPGAAGNRKESSGKDFCIYQRP